MLEVAERRILIGLKELPTPQDNKSSPQRARWAVAICVVSCACLSLAVLPFGALNRSTQWLSASPNVALATQPKAFATAHPVLHSMIDLAPGGHHGALESAEAMRAVPGTHDAPSNRDPFIAHINEYPRPSLSVELYPMAIFVSFLGIVGVLFGMWWYCGGMVCNGIVGALLVCSGIVGVLRDMHCIVRALRGM